MFPWWKSEKCDCFLFKNESCGYVYLKKLDFMLVSEIVFNISLNWLSNDLAYSKKNSKGFDDYGTDGIGGILGQNVMISTT